MIFVKALAGSTAVLLMMWGSLGTSTKAQPSVEHGGPSPEPGEPVAEFRRQNPRARPAAGAHRIPEARTAAESPTDAEAPTAAEVRGAVLYGAELRDDTRRWKRADRSLDAKGWRITDRSRDENRLYGAREFYTFQRSRTARLGRSETRILRLPFDTQTEDRWIAFDKVQHLTFSFLWTLGTQYVAVNKGRISEQHALPLSITSSAAAGVSKEVYDYRIGPTRYFSLKDLVADALGILLATGVILL